MKEFKRILKLEEDKINSVKTVKTSNVLVDTKLDRKFCSNCNKIYVMFCDCI